MTSPLIIFDLDGTLVDTAPDLIDSLNHTIGHAGLEPVTFEDLTHLVGQGVKVMIRRAFELRKVELTDEMEIRLIDRYLAHYKKHMPGDSRPYPGVEECLDRMESAGFRLAVCTNKSEELALPLLEKLGLLDRFSAVTCGDTFPFRKPDARHIFGTVERAGGVPGTSVMIGDSINDILAAQNAEIPSVAVTFGYSDVPIAALGASHVIDNYEELTAGLIHKLLRPAR